MKTTMLQQQQDRRAALGKEMGEDFNDRFVGVEDRPRTIAAAFFISWAGLHGETEKAFLDTTCMSVVRDSLGMPQVTYDPLLAERRKGATPYCAECYDHVACEGYCQKGLIDRKALENILAAAQKWRQA